jgi:hypothetical protein
MVLVLLFTVYSHVVNLFVKNLAMLQNLKMSCDPLKGVFGKNIPYFCGELLTFLFGL